VVSPFVVEWWLEWWEPFKHRCGISVLGTISTPPRYLRDCHSLSLGSAFLIALIMSPSPEGAQLQLLVFLGVISIGGRDILLLSSPFSLLCSFDIVM